MKKFKWLFFAFILIPCLFMMTGCIGQQRVVVGIERVVDSSELVDVYKILYSDGSSDTFTVENGEDGKDLTIDAIYNSAKENGYTGTFLEFLEDYLNINVNQNNTVSAVNKAIFSSVALYSEIPMTSGNFLQTTKTTAMGFGSGVIYKLDKTAGDAYIITNFHNVYNANCDTHDKFVSKIVCFLYGEYRGYGYEVDAQNNVVYRDLEGNVTSSGLGYPSVEYVGNAINCEYVGGSMLNDIAVLKITGSEVLKNSNAVATCVANSDDAQVGTTAIAIGNPNGEGISTTQGIVSVDSENLSMIAADEVTNVTFRVMRIDTAVNGGNSGGGLFNQNGELIGIVNAKIVEDSIENIGYAIPSNVATRIADNIIANSASSTKKPKKATLGITIEGKNFRSVYDKEKNLIKIVEDVYVNKIEENSLISTSSLQVGDKITALTVKGKKYTINRIHQLIDLVWLFESGDVIYFEVEGKEPVSVVITAESIKDVI